ncbi:hypothetical protein LguiA_033406 [Lonicera macranthoides]
MGVTSELEAKILEKRAYVLAIIQLIKEEEPSLLEKWEIGKPSPFRDDANGDDCFRGSLRSFPRLRPQNGYGLLVRAFFLHFTHSTFFLASNVCRWKPQQCNGDADTAIIALRERLNDLTEIGELSQFDQVQKIPMMCESGYLSRKIIMEIARVIDV